MHARRALVLSAFGALCCGGREIGEDPPVPYMIDRAAGAGGVAVGAGGVTAGAGGSTAGAGGSFGDGGFFGDGGSAGDGGFAGDGGSTCQSCPPGARCNLGSDCASAVCVSGICQPPTCVDGVWNGDEADVDCGGSCAPCIPCQGACCGVTTCNDGVLNGTESDVDCGGDCCAPCGPARSCNDADDCSASTCTLLVCMPPNCHDCVRNGTETGVDCGGMCEPLGFACGSASGCPFGEGCNDGIITNQETDVDCGGGYCQPCTAGRVCLLARDCASQQCTGGVCQAPTCSDGVENGDETGVDCGGTFCSACLFGALGDSCQAAGDCASGHCADGVCCDSDCTGTCLSCDQTCRRGTCSPVPTGLDPDGECGPDESCRDGGCAPRSRYNVTFLSEQLLITSALSGGGDLIVSNTSSLPLDLSTFSVLSYGDDHPTASFTASATSASTVLQPGEAAGNLSSDAQTLFFGCGLVTEPWVNLSGPSMSLLLSDAPPGDYFVNATVTISVDGVPATLEYRYHVKYDVGQGVIAFVDARRIASD